MELVYLWVENYKNIKNQGFNFSPRFRCDYNPETNKLKIKENKDYIENFFGENINITAIVGKNGSGKSSVLRNLPSNVEGDIKTFIIFSINKKLIIKSFNSIYTDTIKCNIDISNKEQSFGYFSLDYDFLMPDFIDSFSSYFYGSATLANNLIGDIYSIGNSCIDLYKYKSLVNEIIYKYSNLNIIFNYNPSKIKFEKRFGNIKEELDIIRYSLEKNIIGDEYSQTDAYSYINNFLSERLDDENYLLIYFFLNVYKQNEKIVKLLNDIFEPEASFKDIKDELFDFINKDNLNNDLKELIDKFDIYLELFNDNKLFEQKLDIKLLKEEKSQSLDLLFNKKIQKIIEIDFFDENDIEFKHLSQGERNIYTNMLLIYRKIIELRIKNILILLDEPDITLHPSWQKKYINEIYKLLKQFNDKNFHIIFTTHSPFLLSDIPKQNIIFLDTDENGNCKVVDGLNDKKETFGANIHTLLSDSFFMEDGLMGEFAKGKINEIIDFLNDKKTIDEISTKENQIKQVIESIGEPFLKQKLLDMYYKKYSNEKELKIKELEEEIKRLRNG